MMKRLILGFMALLCMADLSEANAKYPWDTYRGDFYDVADAMPTTTERNFLLDNPEPTTAMGATTTIAFDNPEQFYAEVYKREMDYLDAANLWAQLRKDMPDVMKKYDYLSKGFNKILSLKVATRFPLMTTEPTVPTTTPNADDLDDDEDEDDLESDYEDEDDLEDGEDGEDGEDAEPSTEDLKDPDYEFEDYLADDPLQSQDDLKEAVPTTDAKKKKPKKKPTSRYLRNYNGFDNMNMDEDMFEDEEPEEEDVFLNRPVKADAYKDRYEYGAYVDDPVIYGNGDDEQGELAMQNEADLIAAQQLEEDLSTHHARKKPGHHNHKTEITDTLAEELASDLTDDIPGEDFDEVVGESLEDEIRDDLRKLRPTNKKSSKHQHKRPNHHKSKPKASHSRERTDEPEEEDLDDVLAEELALNLDDPYAIDLNEDLLARQEADLRERHEDDILSHFSSRKKSKTPRTKSNSHHKFNRRFDNLAQNEDQLESPLSLRKHSRSNRPSLSDLYRLKIDNHFKLPSSNIRGMNILGYANNEGRNLDDPSFQYAEGKMPDKDFYPVKTLPPPNTRYESKQYSKFYSKALRDYGNLHSDIHKYGGDIEFAESSLSMQAVKMPQENHHENQSSAKPEPLTAVPNIASHTNEDNNTTNVPENDAKPYEFARSPLDERSDAETIVSEPLSSAESHMSWRVMRPDVRQVERQKRNKNRSHGNVLLDAIDNSAGEVNDVDVDFSGRLAKGATPFRSSSNNFRRIHDASGESSMKAEDSNTDLVDEPTVGVHALRYRQPDVMNPAVRNTIEQPRYAENSANSRSGYHKDMLESFEDEFSIENRHDVKPLRRPGSNVANAYPSKHDLINTEFYSGEMLSGENRRFHPQTGHIRNAPSDNRIDMHPSIREFPKFHQRGLNLNYNPEGFSRNYNRSPQGVKETSLTNELSRIFKPVHKYSRLSVNYPSAIPVTGFNLYTPQISDNDAAFFLPDDEDAYAQYENDDLDENHHTHFTPKYLDEDFSFNPRSAPSVDLSDFYATSTTAPTMPNEPKSGKTLSDEDILTISEEVARILSSQNFHPNSITPTAYHAQTHQNSDPKPKPNTPVIHVDQAKSSGVEADEVASDVTAVVSDALPQESNQRSGLVKMLKSKPTRYPTVHLHPNNLNSSDNGSIRTHRFANLTKVQHFPRDQITYFMRPIRAEMPLDNSIDNPVHESEATSQASKPISPFPSAPSSDITEYGMGFNKEATTEKVMNWRHAKEVLPRKTSAHSEQFEDKTSVNPEAEQMEPNDRYQTYDNEPLRVQLVIPTVADNLYGMERPGDAGMGYRNDFAKVFHQQDTSDQTITAMELPFVNAFVSNEDVESGNQLGNGRKEPNAARYTGWTDYMHYVGGIRTPPYPLLKPTEVNPVSKKLIGGRRMRILHKPPYHRRLQHATVQPLPDPDPVAAPAIDTTNTISGTDHDRIRQVHMNHFSRQPSRQNHHQLNRRRVSRYEHPSQRLHASSKVKRSSDMIAPETTVPTPAVVQRNSSRPPYDLVFPNMPLEGYPEDTTDTLNDFAKHPDQWNLDVKTLREENVSLDDDVALKPGPPYYKLDLSDLNNIKKIMPEQDFNGTVIGTKLK